MKERERKKHQKKRQNKNQRFCRQIKRMEQYLALSHGVNQTFDHKNKVFIIFDKKQQNSILKRLSIN